MSETNVAVKDPEAPVVEKVIDNSLANSDTGAGAGETSSNSNTGAGETFSNSDTGAGETSSNAGTNDDEEKKKAPGATPSIRILKDGDEKTDDETIYTVNGDVVKDSNGNDLNDESLKKKILALVNTSTGQEGGRRRSRRNRRNGHRQSKKRQQKRQSKNKKQNGGKKRRNSKRNQKK